MKNGKKRNVKGDDDHFACVPAPLVYVSYRYGRWAGYNKKKTIGKQAQQDTQNAHC